MNCDRCERDFPSTIVSEYVPNLCSDCLMGSTHTHLEVQAIRTPNCTGEVTVEFGRPESVTVNFETETPIRFDYTEVAEISDPSFGGPENDLGSWTDIRLQEFYNREIGDSYLNWTTKERRKIKARFNSMRIAQRQQLAAKDAIIEQLRERLDRAKRGS